MVRPSALYHAACVVMVLLAAHCDAQGKGMGKVGGMGKGGGKVVGMGKGDGKVVVMDKGRVKGVMVNGPVTHSAKKTAVERAMPKSAVSCDVVVKSATSQQHFEHDGFNTIIVKGDNCKFVDETRAQSDPPGGSALVCFLYGTLLIMPMLYLLSTMDQTMDFTWAFLDSFMGLFLGSLWWSCFQESFDELDLVHRVGWMVAVRFLLVPGVLFCLKDHPQLHGVASVGKHVCAFIAVSTGTEALKLGCSASAELLGICLLFGGFQMAVWKVKHELVEQYVRKGDPKPHVGHMHRWDEVTTELGLDAAALSLAAMLFLSVNMMCFGKLELLQKEADLSMGNTAFYDQPQEGAFAAVYALVMFAVTIVMESAVGAEQPLTKGTAAYETGEIAECKRVGKVQGRLGGDEVVIWETVIVKGMGVPTRRGSDTYSYTCELVDETIIAMKVADVVAMKQEGGLSVQAGNLRPIRKVQVEDQLQHLIQLTMVTSASWSGLLAMSFLVRQHLFPYLLLRRLEGSLLVSCVLMFLSGAVILGLAAHSQNKFMSSKVMRYFRVYFLRALSLSAALSWDMTFDAAMEDLPMEAMGYEAVYGRLFVAALVSFFVMPIYVLKMRPSIAASTLLLEEAEKEELSEAHEKRE